MFHNRKYLLFGGAVMVTVQKTPCITKQKPRQFALKPSLKQFY